MARVGGSVALGGVAGLSARVLAFWFGSLCLLNVLAGLRHPEFDPNIWWIDLRFVPSLGAQLLLSSVGAHLPRIKLAYARAGLDAWTVPARTSSIPRTRAIVAREIPAFWLYYLRAVVA